jgi:hypothetical protein
MTNNLEEKCSKCGGKISNRTRKTKEPVCFDCKMKRIRKLAKDNYLKKDAGKKI